MLIWYSIAVINHIPINSFLCSPHMTLTFLFVLIALQNQPIFCSALPEIKFQSLKAKHLPPEEANLNGKILMQLLLHSYLCLQYLKWQCHSFVFLTLVYGHLLKLTKIFALWFLLIFLLYLLKLFYYPEHYGYYYKHLLWERVSPIVIGNDWSKFGMVFSNGKGWSSLFLIDPQSLVQCQPLPYPLHTPVR